jgi:hypothetical protein
MNFNIYINDEIGAQLALLSQKEHKSRNLIVREAIEFYIKQKTTKKWSQEILNFEGVKNIKAFEEFRSELPEPQDKDFFLNVPS